MVSFLRGGTNIGLNRNHMKQVQRRAALFMLKVLQQDQQCEWHDPAVRLVLSSREQEASKTIHVHKNQERLSSGQTEKDTESRTA